VPDADGLYPIGNASALPNQLLALAVWTLCILLLRCRDGHHAAVLLLATQPAEEGTLEQSDIKPIRLRAAMLP